MIKAWKVSTDKKIWEGMLFLPGDPKAMVLFAHGSGSGKNSSRNNFIASFLQNHEIASFLFDLTTPSERDSDYFDVTDFGKRLFSLADTIKKDNFLASLPLFYFGCSTGAAVVVEASIRDPELVHGIICRGGRVDLTIHLASKVTSPVLLIVGEKDTEVKEINLQFFLNLETTKTFEIISGAGHLFDEPGKLEEVAEITVNWLNAKLSHPKTSPVSFLKSTDKAHV